MASNLFDLPLELLDNIYQSLDFPSVLAMRIVSKASKYWVEVATLNRIKNSHIDYFRISLWGTTVKIEFYIFQLDNQSRLKSRIFIVFMMSYLRFSPHTFRYTFGRMLACLKGQKTNCFFDKTAPFLCKATYGRIGLHPATPFTCMLASKLVDGKTLLSARLHLADPVEANDFVIPFVAKIVVTVVYVMLSTNVFQFNDFLVNLATNVQAIIVSAPISNNDSVKEPIHYQRLQQLSFDVLSSNCVYFDLVDAFVKIPRNEADALATMLSRIQDKDFYFGVSTSETEPRHELFFNIPLVVEKMINSDRLSIRIGIGRRLRTVVTSS